MENRRSFRSTTKGTHHLRTTWQQKLFADHIANRFRQARSTIIGIPHEFLSKTIHALRVRKQSANIDGYMKQLEVRA